MGNRRLLLLPLVLFLVICACTAQPVSRRGLVSGKATPSDESSAPNDAVSWKASSASGTPEVSARHGNSKAEKHVPGARVETVGGNHWQQRRATNTWTPAGNQHPSRSGPVTAQHHKRGTNERAAPHVRPSGAFRVASSADVALRHHNPPRGSGSGGWAATEQRSNENRNGAQHGAAGIHMAAAEDVAIRHHNSPRGSGSGRWAAPKQGRGTAGSNRKGGFKVHSENNQAQHGMAGVHVASDEDVAIHRGHGDGAAALLPTSSASRHGAADPRLAHPSGNGDLSGGDYEGAGAGASNGRDYTDCDGTGDGSSGGGGGGMDVGAILEEHNRARQEVGVADLAWDDGVAAAAAEWANNLASRGCPLEHGGAEGLGQNLYWRAPAGLTPEEDRMAVQSWVAEKADWTYSPVPEGCADGRMCGHYTQVVWRDTTHVGCASAQCPDGGGMWVCDYSPPGNFVGSTPF
ncbi:hypothetical protein CLOM_g8348 [Closterium sp. NIES-68]|nr:hypothetical protein CLOM_g17658 [Closterium sp. NIES-68]GJP49087.1 hypothetical protein CLOM_g8348 [Closterium sp. NIES-68]GJP77420.1 hypothetical protein CLOP_g7816 [Closterium sp. NIES-67]GJP82013.1 hypothetical protein CLOP_g12134 [Closterium sp. NIES-67]